MTPEQALELAELFEEYCGALLERNVGSGLVMAGKVSDYINNLIDEPDTLRMKLAALHTRAPAPDSGLCVCCGTQFPCPTLRLVEATS